jgi:hypothetical protein
MHRPIATLLALWMTGACEFERDRALDGYYGPTQAGARASAGSSQGGSSVPEQSLPADANGGMRSPDQVEQTPMAASTGGTTAPADPRQHGPCDLSGRWLSTEHFVTDALGQLQYAHNYLYYEIAQEADAFRITKGLQCGGDALGTGDLSASISFRASWPATIAKVKYTDRAGKSAPAAMGCTITLDKWYTVRGASLPHYLDPAVPLPAAEEKATDDKPGWEDWDNDGQPGITGVLSGAITGKIFVSPRAWTSMTGTVPEASRAFSLPLQWGSETNVIAYDGSPLLVSDATRAADASLHFVEFARLEPEEATGDDATLCARIVELAPTLTPRAAGL